MRPRWSHKDVAVTVPGAAGQSKGVNTEKSPYDFKYREILVLFQRPVSLEWKK